MQTYTPKRKFESEYFEVLEAGGLGRTSWGWRSANHSFLFRPLDPPLGRLRLERDRISVVLGSEAAGEVGWGPGVAGGGGVARSMALVLP